MSTPMDTILASNPPQSVSVNVNVNVAPSPSPPPTATTTTTTPTLTPTSTTTTITSIPTTTAGAGAATTTNTNTTTANNHAMLATAIANPNIQKQQQQQQQQQMSRRATRKPGRPATYVFDKPDDQLTEKERKMKTSIEKRRIRQNRSYHRRKGKKQLNNSSTNANNTNNLNKSIKQNLINNISNLSSTNALPPSTLHHVLTNTFSSNTPHPWQIAFNTTTNNNNNNNNNNSNKSTSTTTNNTIESNNIYNATVNSTVTATTSNSPATNATTITTPTTTTTSVTNSGPALDITNTHLPSHQSQINTASLAAAVSAASIPNNNNNNASSTTNNLAPKFIPGFAQNPLDLLASATAGRSNPPHSMSVSQHDLPSCVVPSSHSTPQTLSIPSSSIVPSISDANLQSLTNNDNTAAAVTTTITATAATTTNINNNDNSNNQSMNTNVGGANTSTSDLLRSTPNVEDSLDIDTPTASAIGPNPQLDEISSFSLGLDVHKAVSVANQQQQDEEITEGDTHQVTKSDSLLIVDSTEDPNNISMKEASDEFHNNKNTGEEVEAEQLEEIETIQVIDTDDMESEDPTEALVESALVAAKEYAKDPMNLKDVMDRETDLQRMTGIKTIVFDNLRSKYMGMSNGMQQALRHFIIFPRSFDLNAAAAVAGLNETQFTPMQGMLEAMIQTNFITTSKGRYELNEAARLFLNEDASVLNDHIINSTYHVAQKRFISHYQKQLSQLQDDNIHKIGWLREQAMALFDCERENMEFSEYLLNGRTNDLRQFLSAGITVMRYCVSANNRERALRKALEEDETSTEDIFFNFSEQNQQQQQFYQQQNQKSKEEAEKEDRAHRARLHLALSEACFDQLKLSEAEEPLLQALKLMGHTQSYDKIGSSTETTTRTSTTAGLRTSFGSSSTATTTSTKGSSSVSMSSNIVDAVLVLLLLSNLRMTAKRVKEARVLCVKALRILAEANLGRSTFGINAMSNLVSIYLVEGHLQKAKSVAGKLLDTLNTMRYTGMPIYADVLGVCAMVSMAEGNHSEAEKQYSRALETVGKWGSKEWTGIPVQHCLDLDLWLMEGLAQSVRKQGKIQDAILLEQRAAEDRRSRGLPHQATPASLESDLGDSNNNNNNHIPPPSLRHLY